METTFSPLAQQIFDHKYAHDVRGGKESWTQTSHRVTKHVLGAARINMSLPDAKATKKLIVERKFLPGGRYLYAAGRPYHQTQNCLLLRCHDSREGWAELLYKAGMALMTGAGIGVDYSDVRARGSLIRRTGGLATGPIALMKMLNECGRGIMQGGSRRSAIWAGLKWSHGDAFEFTTVKDWSPLVRKAKEEYFDFPAPLDGTNVSIILDDDFFDAYHDVEHSLHNHARAIYWQVIKRMLKTGEPGFSIDVGNNAGESLRNAPVSGDTWVLSAGGYIQVKHIVDKPVTLWTGKQWANNVHFKKTKEYVQTLRIGFTGDREIKADPEHEFFVERYTGKGSRRKLDRVDKVPARQLKVGDVLHKSAPTSLTEPFNKQGYTLGVIYADGSFGENGQADVTFCTDEKKACSQHLYEDWFSSITDTDSRGYKRVYFKSGTFKCNKSFYPHLGPYQKPSWIAGLFDMDGSYDEEQQRVRLSSSRKWFLEHVRRDLEALGIFSGISGGIESGYDGDECFNLTIMASSVAEFQRLIPTKRLKINAKDYKPYRESLIRVTSIELGPVEDVFCCDVKLPEHSFMAEGVIISNCTEVTSADDSDICNLGSINLARIESLDEMIQAVRLGTQFLMAGTLYSDVPYDAVDKTRTKNRRLGLGLMGIHEWLLRNGKRYGPDSDLEEYLIRYAASTSFAHEIADGWGVSRPVKTRAIAPTGTIGLIAETTTGIEPIMASAYKRRYLKGDSWHYQYVIDPTAKKLIDDGIDPDAIEDAYTIDPERRVKFQVWVQKYVDHGISSTINLPKWGTEANNEDKVEGFGNMLIHHLPHIRGITTYPDGARGGQPIVPVKYTTAIKHLGKEMTEVAPADVCEISKGGTCGD